MSREMMSSSTAVRRRQNMSADALAVGQQPDDVLERALPRAGELRLRGRQCNLKASGDDAQDTRASLYTLRTKCTRVKHVFLFQHLDKFAGNLTFVGVWQHHGAHRVLSILRQACHCGTAWPVWGAR